MCPPNTEGTPDTSCDWWSRTNTLRSHSGPQYIPVAMTTDFTDNQSSTDKVKSCIFPCILCTNLEQIRCALRAVHLLLCALCVLKKVSPKTLPYFDDTIALTIYNYMDLSENFVSV